MPKLLEGGMGFKGMGLKGTGTIIIPEE